MFTWSKKLIDAITAPILEKPVVNTTREYEKESKKDPQPSSNESDSLTRADLNKMTKKQLEDYTLNKFKIDLDRRKRKGDLVEEVLNLINSNSK